MEYEVFELKNNEISKQTYINGLLITPYNDGIAVNFDNDLTLNCKSIQGLKVKLLNYLIEFDNGVFYIGVVKE